MPTIFSHAFVAVAIGATYPAEERPLRFWTLSMLSAVLPDADVIAFAFGIAYSDMFGHRGFSHSLLFALLLSCVVVSSFFREARGRERGLLILFFFLVTASHGLLDAVTNGGLGVAFFAPFDSTRYFFPFRPVEVSPIGIGFFSAEGVMVIASELFWIWLPASVTAAAVLIYRRLATRRN
jgi:inner membrane protein